jgi:N-acetylmuramoyl-L-alanine amidase
MKILIDNGHGENTPGKRSPVWADGSQLLEWEYTREIAQRVENELKKRGVDVERIVKVDIDVPLSTRCKIANEIASEVGAGSCLLVSIHNNAFDGQARGWEVHTYIGQRKSDEYATVFWNEAKLLLPAGAKMRGDHADGDPDYDSNFAILRDTACPALLTENLFMDNEEDCRYLLSVEGKKTIANIHINSILKIVGK